MGRHEAEAMGRQTDLVLDASLSKHKNWGPKYFGFTKFESKENLGQNVLGLKKIVRKKQGLEIFLRSNHFWVQTHLGAHKIWVPKILRSQKIWGLKKFGVKKNWGPKKFGHFPDTPSKHPL